MSYPVLVYRRQGGHTSTTVEILPNAGIVTLVSKNDFTADGKDGSVCITMDELESIYQFSQVMKRMSP